MTGSERVKPPVFDYGPILLDDSVGLSATDLLNRGLKALEELTKETERLHRHLPRKYDQRIRALAEPRGVVDECLRGAKAKIEISQRSLAAVKRR